MNKRLQNLFNLLEEDRIQLANTLKPISFEQFNSASLGKWSIHQILSHLITAEKMSLQYMRKKILGIHEAEESGLQEEAKMILLRLSQKLPFKFKAPRAVIDVTPSYNSVEDLMADWEKERQALKIFLESFENHQLKKKIYKHIRAGMLNIQHALLFFREHYLHHLPQIKRLL